MLDQNNTLNLIKNYGNIVNPKGISQCSGELDLRRNIYHIRAKSLKKGHISVI